MLKWRLSEEAENDMREIRRFSMRYWGEEQSGRYIKAIRAKLELLAQNPHIGMDRGDDLGAGIRSIFIGSHTIYYEFDKKMLTIKAILHQSMTPNLHLQGKLD
jgi:toxin ParE1/3/4